MEDVRKTYDFYMEKYARQWSEVKRTMEMLNLMADDLGIQKPFPSIADGGTQEKPKLREDQFVGKALATAVYEYLSHVGKAVGARPWPEIVQVLRDHGFEGLPKTKSAEEKARENIVKSPKIKLVGENSFGLTEWYPKKRDKNKEEEDREPEEEPARGRPKKVKSDAPPDNPKRQEREEKTENPK